MAVMSRKTVLGYRVRAQQIDRSSGTLSTTAILDLGVQETGPDGGRWALALRGVDVAAMTEKDLAVAWTLRGAPHLYRRNELPQVAEATAPFSDADAGKRIYDAAKPLREAGVPILEALDEVAAALRSAVRRPTVKGDVSTAVTKALPEPYRRYCTPCDAIHLYEMPFRLAALRGGLELQAGTSPPVLQRIKGFKGFNGCAPSDEPSSRHDVVRGYLRLLGPATPKHVAEYLDAPVKEVRARWPEEAREVKVDGEARWVLAEADELHGDPIKVTRLLGPFDLYLQARDREVLVPDTDRRKALWPTLGRPGAVLLDGDIVGTWRPRQARRALTVEVTAWSGLSAPKRRSIEEQAERLAAHREVDLGGVDIAT